MERMKLLVFLAVFCVMTSSGFAQPDAGPVEHTSDRALKLGLEEMIVTQNGNLFTKEIYGEDGELLFKINYGGKKADTVKAKIYDDHGNILYDRSWTQVREYTYYDDHKIKTETKYKNGRKQEEVEYTYLDGGKTIIQKEKYLKEFVSDDVTFMTKNDDKGRKKEYFMIARGDTIKKETYKYIGNLTEVHFFQPGLVLQFPFLDKTVLFDSTYFEFNITKRDEDGVQTFEETNRVDTIATKNQLKLVRIKNKEILWNRLIEFTDSGDTLSVWKLNTSNGLKEATIFEYHPDGRIKSQIKQDNSKFVFRKMDEGISHPDSMTTTSSIDYEYNDSLGITIATARKEAGSLNYKKTIDSQGRIVRYEKPRNLIKKSGRSQVNQIFDYEYNSNGDIIKELIQNRRETRCIYNENNLLIEKVEKNLYDNSEKVTKWEYKFYE